MPDEAALDASIMSALDSAGLDINSDTEDVPDAPTVDEGDDDSGATPDGVDTPEVEDPAPVVDEPTGDTADEVGKADGEKAPKETPAEAAKHEEEDELAAALGLGKPPEDKAQRAAWWKRRMPYSQVHKEYSALKKKWAATHEDTLKPLNEQISSAKKYREDVAKTEKYMESEPLEYLSRLAAARPDTYGKLLAAALGKNVEAPPTAEEEIGEQPQPNYKLPDGSMTYDIVGLQALREYDQKVITRELQKTFKPHLDFVDQQKKEAEQARTKQQQAENDRAVTQAKDDALADLLTWDFVTEADIPAILEAASKLPANLNMHQALSKAYRQVIMPKVKADRDKMTKDIVANQKKAVVKNTTLGVVQSRTPTTDESKPTADNEDARIMAALKRRGLSLTD